MRIIPNSESPVLPSPFGLRHFYEKRNKVCIVCSAFAGIGDFLMMRMMFDDFKRISPEIKITLATIFPEKRYDFLADHPSIDEFVPAPIDYTEYGMVYDVTNAPMRYEYSVAPFSGDHRSDVYAASCGVSLTTHDMHFTLSEKTKQRGKSKLDDYCSDYSKPRVAFCPRSNIANKNLNESQMRAAVDAIRDHDAFVFGIHNKPIVELARMQVPVLYDMDLQTWMGVVNAIDYMVAVDTSNFYLAGGMGKPLTGIFAWADGKVYGKYFNLELVQKHRDNGNWPCGPCFHYEVCPKTKEFLKPCITELTSEEIANGIHRMFARYPHYNLA